MPYDKPEDLEHLTPLDNSIHNIGASLNNIGRLQKYFRTRENRNFATVKSTVGRIYYFSMLECFLIVSVAVLQVQKSRYNINVRFLSYEHSSKHQKGEFKFVINKP